jgi:hypothetical protein
MIAVMESLPVPHFRGSRKKVTFIAAYVAVAKGSNVGIESL